MAYKYLILSAMAALLLMGCEKAKQSSSGVASATRPAQASATIQQSQVALQPTTSPAAQGTTTKPVISETLVIREINRADDHGFFYEFPAARLHINADDHTAVLYSDDPKTAIDHGYGGNSYYLVIPLEKADPIRLNNYQWTFKAVSSDEHQESADGIFLDGQRYHLQSSEVQITFNGESPTVRVAVFGEFMRFDSSAGPGAHLPTPVEVRGILNATVDQQK